MQVGVGLGASLDLTFDQHIALARRAAELGYGSLWTSDDGSQDVLQLCLLRWQATAEVVPGGLLTATGVIPVNQHSPMSLSVRAATLNAITGGRFLCGIGVGPSTKGGTVQLVSRAGRIVSSLSVMRDYLVSMRGLLAGQRVDYEGDTLSLHGAQLSGHLPQRTPVFAAALGPKMLRLAGGLADGVVLNWSTPAHRTWARDRVAEGARAAGRKHADIPIAEYVRVCVDDDTAAARAALAQALLRYVVGPTALSAGERRFGYRAHFERMGFGQRLSELDQMRLRGASRSELISAFPDEILSALGYFGPASGAREAFLRLAEGLDIAILRVVPARREPASILAAMCACAPNAVADES